MTPTLAAIHQRSVAFRAQIARRALLVVQKPDNRRFIPNTPYGVPKLHPEPPKPDRNIEPDYWHLMWFHDLVYGRAIQRVWPPRVEEILRAVAVEFEVSKLDLISSRRTKDIVTARQVAAYLAKKLTGKSLPEIGRRIGGRDHTTILYSVAKVERLILTDIELAGRVEKVRASLA